jgi:hypothetical protein
MAQATDRSERTIFLDDTTTLGTALPFPFSVC